MEDERNKKSLVPFARSGEDLEQWREETDIHPLDITLFTEDEGMSVERIEAKIGRYYRGFLDSLVSNEAAERDWEKDFIYQHYIGYINTLKIDVANIVEMSDVKELIRCDLELERLDRSLARDGVDEYEYYQVFPKDEFKRVKEEGDEIYGRRVPSTILMDIERISKRKEKIQQKLFATREQKAKLLSETAGKDKMAELIEAYNKKMKLDKQTVDPDFVRRADQ